MNGREARTERASEKFGRNVRARNAQSTFGKPLACVTGIFDHAFGKPLTWIADKFTYTFDPLLTASKGVSKNTFDTQFTGVHRWVKTAFTAFDLGGKGAFKDDLWCASKVIKFVQRWPLQNLWPHIWCAVKAIFRAVQGHRANDKTWSISLKDFAAFENGWCKPNNKTFTILVTRPPCLLLSLEIYIKI